MTDIQVDKAKARQTDAQRSVPEAVAMAMCAPGGVLIGRNGIALFSAAADVKQVSDRQRMRGM